jgi:AraC family transcriptional regulator
MESILVRSSEPRAQDVLPCLRGTDSLLENFVRIVLPPPEASKVLRGFYTEALHTVLLTRLAALRECGGDDQGCGVRALSKWRLRRVYEFVDANLENRISLKMLACAAGVSRMYFAAQFRAATGMRPHSYVSRRRMEHAKTLLATPGSSIVDIAFSVGFQTQSHFTTVFKRLEGVTPHRWRELHGVEGGGLPAIVEDDGRGGAQPGL